MRYLILLLLSTCVLVTSANAQTYTLERAVVSAAGGTVTGGPFELNFSLGQVAAGRSSGTNTVLTSGFWWEITSTPSVDVEDPEKLPTQYALNQNAPNPFLNRTTIRYAIPEASGRVPVWLRVYDVQGRLVKTLVHDHQGPGRYTVTWNGSTDSGGFVSAGIYLLHLTAPLFHEERRIVMLR